MTKYHVVLEVTHDRLDTVIGVVKDAAIIVSVNVAERSEAAAPKKKKMRYANGLRSKGITAEALGLEILKGNKAGLSLSSIKSLFVEKGFAETTAAPTMSLLVRDKKVKRFGDDRYALEPVT